jgi:hypothetical protein
MSSAEPAALEQSGRTRLWWTVPAAIFFTLFLLAMLFGNQENVEKQKGTSYDASSNGYRAAYLLLEELRYPVTRSRRPTGGQIRFMFSPSKSEEDATLVDQWVRTGGILILADATGDFADELDISLKIHHAKMETDLVLASGGEATQLAPGTARTDWPRKSGRVWARAGDSPAITIYDRGRGEIWLVNMPELFDNKHLRKGDNAILLSRLADNVLARRQGSLIFDEYFHGLRDRPTVTELLFKPPALWISIQGLLVIVLVIWHYAPRFGTFRPEALVRRRSKEEFLDAMAALLERKGDYADAYRTVRDDLLRAMERSLGLPPGAPPEQLVQAAVVHRGKGMEALLAPLTTVLPANAGKLAFLNALNELETIRDRFFDKRSRRQAV